jgi:hypothetical protein
MKRYGSSISDNQRQAYREHAECRFSYDAWQHKKKYGYSDLRERLEQARLHEKAVAESKRQHENVAAGLPPDYQDGDDPDDWREDFGTLPLDEQFEILLDDLNPQLPRTPRGKANINMGMYDLYYPNPAPSCPDCQAKLEEFQSKDGPCDLNRYEQGSRIEGMDYEVFHVKTICPMCNQEINAECHMINARWQTLYIKRRANR